MVEKIFISNYIYVHNFIDHQSTLDINNYSTKQTF